jgi:ATP-grasp domain, R2K clade family 3
MNAFVKTTNGKFPNPNFCYAWKGLTEMQYNVTCFEDSDLKDPSFWMSCNRSTPVFAGVVVFDEILAKLGVDYKKIDTYPEILYPYLNRFVDKTTIGEYRAFWDKEEDNRPLMFMKPVKQKQFNGKVMKSILDWIGLTGLPDNTEVYISEPVNFVTEYRIYIRDGRLLLGRNYRGDWTKTIDVEIVKKAIKTFEPESPCAYALDFGLTDDGKTSLIEFNDATSLGNYGLNAISFADMIASRWSEICLTEKYLP